jgi:hypothetical protein
MRPYNGRPAYENTEAYIFYDKTAVYVCGRLYDSHPDSIFNYLTERDNFGMADFFGAYIDPYNEGQLAFGFFVTSAGVQVDAKAAKNSNGDIEDANWNAVWESQTTIDSLGWTVEMKIPFSALRFSEKTGSTWGLNFFRNIRRYNSNNSWSLVSRNISGFIHQEGQLTGLNIIKSPFRLWLSPYISTYYKPRSSSGKSDFLYKGGLDLKYGINDAFTLDMMLIPDFGQIQSDDQKLNLSPYELFFDERRQFFTEGTELFQRGNVFYSRRIGSAPKFSTDGKLGTNDTLTYKPTETRLVNASKISGRTKNGLGIGVLNAMSFESYATVRDKISHTERDILVQPFTNYNVTVLDKTLPNNSFISLITTNVSMIDNPFYANVTATEFQLKDKTKNYALKGKGGFSSRMDSTVSNGYYGVLGVEKNGGKFQWGLTQHVYSDKYNPNDLGYLQRNNRLMTDAWMYYQIIEPFFIFREMNVNIWYNYNRMYSPNTLYDHEYGLNYTALFKNNYRFQLNANFTGLRYDYYETRTPNRFYTSPFIMNFSPQIDTDSRKKLRATLMYTFASQPANNAYKHDLSGTAYYRIGNRMELSYGLNVSEIKNEKGFSAKETNDSIVLPV